MSVDLKDFRGKLTIEADAALEAVSRVTGRDKTEVAREILHEWALRKIREATVLDGLLRSEGAGGIWREAGGAPGNRRESEGR